MKLYTLAVAIHVVVAVAGIGLVGAIPLTARLARKRSDGLATSEASLGLLLLVTQISLAVVALSGVALDFTVAGAFHRMAWFKASIVLLVVAGLAHARARAALRRRSSLDGVERWGWVLTGAIALIAALMEIKPVL
jgi:hypothetical protein